MKLPRPPLPRALRPRPRRPGDGPSRDGANGSGNGSALREQAREVPVSVVGWLDERSGISPLLRSRFS